jgi:ubiquinone/menaquinone biosynthesis C-methylase UbiE
VSRADTTRREFSLQAEALERAPTFTSRELADRLCDALGDRRTGRILDLACGPGLVSEALAAEAEQVVGVDLTPEMVDRARERCRAAGHDNTEFHEAAVEALPMDDGVFDAVVTRLAIHHFEDPEAVLREARRVLTPGGLLVILDIIASEDEDEARLHNALEELRDPSHVRLLPPSELQALVERTGFDVRNTERWSQQRQFGEWAAIVAAARSIEPLAYVMGQLAGAGLDAGVGLRVEEGDVRFDHHWLLVAATRRG